MTAHDTRYTRTPAEIEAQIAMDRERLAASVDALRARFTPSALAGEAQSFLVSNAEVSLRVLDGAVRRNPLALAVIGAGLAWFALGRSSRKAAAKSPNLPSRVEALMGWEDEGGAPAPEPHLEPLADEHWLREAESLRSRAVAAFARLDRMARDRMAPAAEIAAAKARVSADLAASVASAMGEGLMSLSQTARDRVIAARDAAWRARLATGRTTAAAVDRNPFLSGAVAVATGAALAAALPRTDAEDRILGPESDRLLDDARRALADERDRAAQLARSLADHVVRDLSRPPQPAGHAAGHGE